MLRRPENTAKDVRVRNLAAVSRNWGTSVPADERNEHASIELSSKYQTTRRYRDPERPWGRLRADSGGTTSRRNARRRHSTASARSPGSAARKCATWWPNAPRRCRSQRPGSFEAEILTCQFPSKWPNVACTLRLTPSTTASSFTSETVTPIVFTTTTGRCSANSAPPVPA
jgi:hypothetical protein